MTLPPPLRLREPPDGKEITGIAGQILAWDGTGWVPTTPSGGGGGGLPNQIASRADLESIVGAPDGDGFFVMPTGVYNVTASFALNADEGIRTTAASGGPVWINGFGNTITAPNGSGNPYSLWLQGQSVLTLSQLNLHNTGTGDCVRNASSSLRSYSCRFTADVGNAHQSQMATFNEGVLDRHWASRFVGGSAGRAHFQTADNAGEQLIHAIGCSFFGSAAEPAVEWQQSSSTRHMLFNGCRFDGGGGLYAVEANGAATRLEFHGGLMRNATTAGLRRSSGVNNFVSVEGMQLLVPTGISWPSSLPDVLIYRGNQCSGVPFLGFSAGTAGVNAKANTQAGALSAETAIVP